MATKINREALRQRIKTLAGLSDDERAALLELVNSKKYGLVWENHPEEVEERLRTHLPVLDEVPERYIPGSSASSPNHILIEGDNLEALTALTYTHEGRIDVIYIDPPYNTGNKDFVYNDHYVDADDDYRHSKWLSFMSKRLRIAKRLLSDRGVIFISIDDNEQANLKLLCDEVFGEHNFIADMIWEQGKKHIGTFVGINHEYMVVYAKWKEYINDNRKKWHQKKEGLEKIYAIYDRLKRTYRDSYADIEAGMKTFYDSLPESDPAYNSKHYSKVDERGLFFPDNISQGTGNGPRYDVMHPVTGKPVTKPAGGWRYAYNTMQELLKENRIFFGEDETKVPCRKRYLKETEYELPCSVFYRDGRGATKELETLLGKSIFDHPKDRNEIERIINFRENYIVLDFFAGSGTTMHAVMQLNKEDGGHRQCILVTNNENKICEEVTYERNRRVIQGYTTPKGVEVEGLKDNSLRYYRTRLLPRRRTNRNMRDLMAAATDLLCIKEDIFEELRIQNLEIRNIRKHVRLFGKGDRLMMVIYSEEAIPRIVEWLKTTPPLPSSEGWPKAGVCSNEGWPKAGVATKITHNLSEPTPNPSPGGDAAAPPAPIDATTTTPPTPIDATTAIPPAPLDATTTTPPAPIDATTTIPPAPLDATTAAPAQSPLERGTAIAGGYVKEGWPKAGVCSNPIKVYTFSYTNYAYDDDFAEVENRVQLCALPAAIYEAYRRVLPQENRYYDNEIIDGSDINEGKEDNQ